MATVSRTKSVSIPLAERLKSIPGFFGIRLGDEAHYTLMKSEGPFEIRHYDPMTVASLFLRRDYEHALEEGFLRLANHIFGRNHGHPESVPRWASPSVNDQARMEMVAPVLQENLDTGWKISFILPPDYNLKTAPLPDDPEIVLSREPTRMMAVMRYSGVNDDQAFAKKSEDLRTWLRQHPEYRAISNPVAAEYDGPLTLPFLRRNEVQIRVERVVVAH